MVPEQILPGVIETRPSTERPGGPSRVLVIEDDHYLRRLFSFVLIRGGQHTVVTAPSGELALEYLQHATANGPEKEPPPDVILVDFGLPGMDGGEVIARIRGDPALSNIPIALLSGDSSRLTSGADRYVAKPIDNDGLLQLVRELAEKARKAREPAPLPA